MSDLVIIPLSTTRLIVPTRLDEGHHSLHTTTRQTKVGVKASTPTHAREPTPRWQTADVGKLIVSMEESSKVKAFSATTATVGTTTDVAEQRS